MGPCRRSSSVNGTPARCPLRVADVMWRTGDVACSGGREQKRHRAFDECGVERGSVSEEWRVVESRVLCGAPRGFLC